MYDRRHLYLSFGGTLAITEEWTTGLHFAHPEGGGGDHNVTEDEWTALVGSASLKTDLQTLISTWFSSGNNNAAIGALANLNWLKLAYLDLDGTYLSDPPIQSDFGPVIPPVTTSLPPQVSYVISLRSGNVLGDANYGRMYAPPPSWLVGQNNGVATNAQATGARVAAKVMINGITSRLANQVPGVAPCIMSRKGIGTTKRITKIGVGVVLDTQRRRRTKLAEATTLENL